MNELGMLGNEGGNRELFMEEKLITIYKKERERK